MREAGWTGLERDAGGAHRSDDVLHLVFIFCFSMIFLSTQIDWTGQILEEGPRLCLLLADRIGREIGPIGRGGVPARLLGRGLLVGARRLSRRAVPLRRHAARVAAAAGAGAAGRGLSRVGGLSGAAAISALLVRRPVWLVFAYTVVGSMFFPFVISTLLWLNNSSPGRARRPQRPAGQHAARRGAGALRVSRRAFAQRVGVSPLRSRARVSRPAIATRAARRRRRDRRAWSDARRSLRRARGGDLLPDPSP